MPKRKPGRNPSDPRKYQSSGMTGGGPHERDATIVDERHAIVLSQVETCMVQGRDGGDQAVNVMALMLGGMVRSGKKEDVRIVYLTDMAGAINVITNMISLFGRSGQAREFVAAFDAVMKEMANDGLTSPGEDDDES
jgi:hypothetical protein